MTDRMIFGMRVLNITQAGTALTDKPSLSHVSYELDLAGSDSGIDYWYNWMPNTYWYCAGSFGTRSTGNTRFYWSVDKSGKAKKVLYADGKERYITLAMTHSYRNYPVGVSAGFSSALSGSPTSITFSYGGNNWQRTRISPPLITLGHSTTNIRVSPYRYGQAALLGLPKNRTSWTTVKGGNFNGTIDCSGYAALAIEAGGYEPGYGASGSGTISVN